VKTYDLYLESGPQMKTTYVHVPALLGCVYNAPTTQQALDAALDAIVAFLRFMARAGERVDAKADFRTRVAEHHTEGGFLGSRFLPTDAEPLSKRESNALMKRLAALHVDLRSLTSGLTPKQLTATPTRGRAIGRILTHVLAEGGYLRGVTGASRIQRLADEGAIDPLDALDQLFELETERLAAMTDAERSQVIQRGQNPWSARSAVRRMLEHGWEHYVEIAERLGATP
jgi:hypothetical protein